MNFWARVPLVLAAFVGFAGVAHQSLAEPPVAYRHLTYEYDVRADGSFVETVHAELQAANPSAAAQIGQIPLRYVESLESLDIPEAYTLKASGKKLPVQTSDIYAQLVPGSPDLALFNDQKQKVVIFPDVAAGDTVVWTAKRSSKASLFPGQFMADQSFPRTFEYDDADVTIRAPASLPLKVETHGLKFEKKSEAGTIIYHWHYENRNALADDPAAVSALDREPRFFASSFQSYDEVAKAYAKMIDGKIAVTPKVRQLADDITAGITDRRQQAQKIYEWTSTHIRYVAVELGTGGIIPHAPDLVIANAYGDCKDHSVLFASLLKAKGIDAQLVLINGRNGYSLSDSPTLGQLDHAITWLPDFGLYADTTAGTASFGTLPLQEYGKPVVLVSASGSALRRTPVVPAGLMSQSVRTVEKLSADGSLQGTTVTTASGPLAAILRGMGMLIQSQDPERVAKQLLQQLNEDGNGSFSISAPLFSQPNYTITAQFDLAARPRLTAGDSFVPFAGLQVMPRPGDGLMGPLGRTDLPDTEETPCFSGSQVEELSLELPPGKHPGALPKDTVIQSGGIQFSSHWAMAGPFLTVHREFKFTTDHPTCSGSERTAAAAALKQIREDYRAAVALAGS